MTEFIYHHATCLIFFELWKWREAVDIDNLACLVPLHVPTIYSKDSFSGLTNYVIRYIS